MNGVVGKARWATGRTLAAVGAWIEGSLSTADMARIAKRVILRRPRTEPHEAQSPAEESGDDSQASQILADATAQIEAAGRIIHLNAALRADLERAQATAAHLRRVEGEWQVAAASSERLAGELATARSGIQAAVNAVQATLFEIDETSEPGRAAATLIAGDRPVRESLATLVNLSEPLHGARPFQYIMPFLADLRPFPLPWPEGAPPLRIVDAGSQELATEADMHAPLRGLAPAEVIGFDPFTPPNEADSNAPVEVTRPDGTAIRTYPMIVGDGGPVTLHVNRYEATSSVLPANLPLARPFGLLAMALETTATRDFRSHRLDDVLPPGPVDLLKIDVQGVACDVLTHARRVLETTLVCHVEVEFAPIYQDQRLFADVDALLRAAGFSFVDFFSLGRQRYASFDTSRERAFHRGRTLWADCIYIRGLDDPEALDADELFRAALIVHACYNKQDLAAELLARRDRRVGAGSGDGQHAALLPTYLAASGVA